MENETVQGPVVGKSPKVVVVVGNGFDLDLQLKTSYNDFVESGCFEALLQEHHPMSSSVEQVYRREMQIYPNGLAQFIKDKKNRNNWVDLEECIREYCIVKGKSTFSDLIRKEVNAVRYYMFRFIAMIPRDLQSVFYKNRVSYILFKTLVESNLDFEIWSFNYTFSCETILENLGYTYEMAKSKVHYIHGSLFEAESNNKLSLVLGCNSSKEVAVVCPAIIKNDMIPNYKRLKNQFDLHLMEAEHIIFFGHSMGSTDQQYFKNLLNSPSLKAITVFSRDLSSLNSVRVNLGILPGDFETKVEDGAFSLLKYCTESFYRMDNPDKQGLEDILHKTSSCQYT